MFDILLLESIEDKPAAPGEGDRQGGKKNWPAKGADEREKKESRRERDPALLALLAEFFFIEVVMSLFESRLSINI